MLVAVTMHENLKDIPTAERPKMLPLFPWGAPYFRAWHSLRWFLLMVTPIIASTSTLWFRKQETGLVLFLGLIGAAVTAFLFVALCSGMASSNWGTHFRRGEPVRYWLQVVVIAAAYIFVSLIGYFG